jgi:Cation transporter/ATPase, N-terminus
MAEPPSSLSPSRRQSAISEGPSRPATPETKLLEEGRHGLHIDQPISPPKLGGTGPAVPSAAGPGTTQPPIPVAMPQPVEAEGFSRLISMNMATLNRRQLQGLAASAAAAPVLPGIAQLPVAAFNQTADTSLIPTAEQVQEGMMALQTQEGGAGAEAAAAGPEAVGLAVEGGPEAAVPATPFPEETPPGPSPATAPIGAGPPAAVTTEASPAAVGGGPVAGTTAGGPEVTKVPAAAAVVGEGPGHEGPREGLWLGASRPIKRCWLWCIRRGKKRKAAAAAGKPKGAERAAVGKEYTADEHRLTFQELAERYQTNINFDAPAKSLGLTSEEAAKRLKEDGPNMLSPPKQDPEIIKFLKQFTNLLMLMLIFAAGLAFISYGLTQDWTVLVLAVVLLVVVFLTCTLNWWTERSGELIHLLPRWLSGIVFSPHCVLCCFVEPLQQATSWLVSGRCYRLLVLSFVTAKR